MKKRENLIVVGLLLFALLLPSAASAGYSDVTPDAWYAPDILAMTDLGWLEGYDDGTFRPDRVITAAEFVKIAVLAADGEPRDSGGALHWAEGWMRTAREAGWVAREDIPEDVRLWDAPITRETAVKILMCAVLPELTGTQSQEAQILDYQQVGTRYREKLLAAFAAGIIRGDGNGMVRPQGSMTRAEACAVVLRARRTAATGGEIPKTFQTGGVSRNGHLQVVGTQLCNERGEPILLRGMSSHGIAWFPRFVSADSIRQVAQNGANLMRLAMYTKEYNGYLENPAVKETLVKAVDDSLANDLYTIIDWHILSDGDPREHQEEAIAFFQEMARRYQGNPGVLYEICNEPNGVTWAQIKPYAQAVISTIRQIDPAAVILVGTPNWSQDVDVAAKDPLKVDNILYSFHFYAGTHGAYFRNKVDAALNRGAAVFATEWGLSRADGSGGVYPEQGTLWLDFLEKRGVGWANWSLCDKAETSAAVRPGAAVDGLWSLQDLTDSGKFVFARLNPDE